MTTHDSAKDQENARRLAFFREATERLHFVQSSMKGGGASDAAMKVLEELFDVLRDEIEVLRDGPKVDQPVQGGGAA